MGVPYPPCVSGNPSYADLATVYEWLTPEPLLTPEGNVAAFAPWIDPLPAGARVLDCAAGVGWLAVGLAQRGLTVEATDLSPSMIERTRALAAARGAEVAARVCAWEDLAGEPRFDAVFCIGNSLAHARDRGNALAAMAGVLKPGGLLVLTSRNWERERAAGSRLEVADRLVTRHGRRALAVHAWSIPADWHEPHTVDIAVTSSTPTRSRPSPSASRCGPLRPPTWPPTCAPPASRSSRPRSRRRSSDTSSPREDKGTWPL